MKKEESKTLQIKDKRFARSTIRRYFWHINWLKTLWINFKTQPFSKAIKFPIIVSWNSKIACAGRIILPDNVYPGMLTIGLIFIPNFEVSNHRTLFNNKGTFTVGGNVKLHPGVKLYTRKGTELTVGNHVGFGSNTKVICCKNITIGNDVRISWESQIFDTDFHFLYNTEKEKYYPRIKNVIIGNNVFVGNGTTIGKGTIIPDGCVISCISKVSGDFTEEGENLLISGNPAKVVKKGVNISSGWYPEKEKEIAKSIE